MQKSDVKHVSSVFSKTAHAHIDIVRIIYLHGVHIPHCSLNLDQVDAGIMGRAPSSSVGELRFSACPDRLSLELDRNQGQSRSAEAIPPKSRPKLS